MSKRTYCQYYYDLEYNDIEVHFEYNNSVVFDVEEEMMKMGKEQLRKLVSSNGEKRRNEINKSNY